MVKTGNTTQKQGTARVMSAEEKRDFLKKTANRNIHKVRCYENRLADKRKGSSSTSELMKELKEVFVYERLNNSCVGRRHRIENCSMRVKNLLTDIPFVINVYHCVECDRYFIYQDELTGYIKQRKIPSCRIIDKTYQKLNLSKHSLLNLYGYKAGNNGLTTAERRKLLSRILDRGYMKKYEIINHLYFLLDFNGKKTNMYQARNDWSDDIRYVNNYRINQQKMIKGSIKTPGYEQYTLAI